MWFAQHIEPTVVQVGELWQTALMQLRPLLHVLALRQGPPWLPAGAVGVPQKPLVQVVPVVLQGLAPGQHASPVAPQFDWQTLFVHVPAWHCTPAVQHGPPLAPQAEHLPFVPHCSPELHCMLAQHS